MLTVENDYRAECEVEEESWPITRVNHSQDDGPDKDQHLDQQGPNYPAGQGPPEKQNQFYE